MCDSLQKYRENMTNEEGLFTEQKNNRIYEQKFIFSFRGNNGNLVQSNWYNCLSNIFGFRH